MGDADAYTVRYGAEQLLHGLGFSHEQMNQPVASFSGGWRMRLNLAQALMCPSDLLLLDEPTNHLDLDAIIWVEDWLKRYAGTLVIVSHDRDFLDGVVNVIVHIDAKKLKRYSGHYSSFERQRAAAVVLAAGMMEKQQRERAHLESFIDRFRAKASKAKQAQSRMKRLAKMEELAPCTCPRHSSSNSGMPLVRPDPLLVLDNVDAGYRLKAAARSASSRVKLALQSGQRYGLLGLTRRQSTLIKTTPGSFRRSPERRTSTRDRRRLLRPAPVEMLRDDQSPLCICSRFPIAFATRSCAAFSAASTSRASWRSIRSGNFRRRKARIGAGDDRLAASDLLLLDEPTNHLDLANARGDHCRAGAVRRDARARLARPAPVRAELTSS